MKVALIRIREAADKYLSPRKLSVASSEALPSAAHIGDMLADLLGGLEGPAPSNRVARPSAVGTSSWASAGTAAPVATSNETASASSAGTVPPPPPGTVGIGAAGPSSSTLASTRTFPSAGAGRRADARVDVVAASHEPAQSPGWTRTILDVQLASGSPAASAVDVSVRVGYDGGSVEDTEVIRIIGWSDGSGDTFAPGPMELTPDVVRQFVFEARSDLAIDVETKLGDR